MNQEPQDRLAQPEDREAIAYLSKARTVLSTALAQFVFQRQVEAAEDANLIAGLMASEEGTEEPETLVRQVGRFDFLVDVSTRMERLATDPKAEDTTDPLFVHLLLLARMSEGFGSVNFAKTGMGLAPITATSRLLGQVARLFYESIAHRMPESGDLLDSLDDQSAGLKVCGMIWQGAGECVKAMTYVGQGNMTSLVAMVGHLRNARTLSRALRANELDQVVSDGFGHCVICKGLVKREDLVDKVCRWCHEDASAGRVPGVRLTRGEEYEESSRRP